MEQKTAYVILGVAQTASDDEIKSAYRKLAVALHPDKNPGDTAASSRFCEVTEAYEKVRDPVKRSAYDLTLVNKSPGQPEGNNAHAGTAKTGFDMADALREFMANFRSDTVLRDSFEATGDDPSFGGNIKMSIALTLKESALGVQKTIEVQHLATCKACVGSGRGNGKSSLVKCLKCNGHGILRVAGAGEIITCPQCKGTKQDMLHPCQSCSGSGRVPEVKKVPVLFPAGIGEGNFITLSGFGNAGIRNGKAGDLVVSIEEIPDAQFKRLGYDLETEVTISVLTAILGGKCMLLTLEGETVSLQIPPGTQPETLFGLKELGLPRYQASSRGSLYAKIHVKIPNKLLPNEKELYESLAQIKKGDTEKEQLSRDSENWLLREINGVWFVNAGKRKFDHHIFDLPEVRQVLSEKDRQVALDLRQIEFIASMDIGIWIKAGKALQKNGGKMFLVAPQKTVLEVIRETRIDAIFPIIDPPD